MKTYTAYGLAVSSEIPLSEFPLCSSAGEVTVSYGGDALWSKPFRDRNDFLVIDGNEARFWFKQAGSFVVRDGASIEIAPNHGASEDLLRLYVQGMMMAMVLYQRGFCVLHASVVEIDGAAVAFLGHVGAGKSTIAAAMHARGHAVISDDNAAVLLEEQNAHVWPAYPYLKLFPDIAEAVGYSRSDLRTLYASLAKVGGPVRSRFRTAPAPLRCLYVLGRSHPAEISLLSGQSAIIELIRNSAPTRWGCRGDAAHLRQCAGLANLLPMFRVRTFDTLGAIAPLAAQLETHFRRGIDNGEIEGAACAEDAAVPA